MFVLVAFVIFSAALFGAGYYVWQVPQQQSQDILAARLRELRARTGGRARTAPDLIKREKRGSLAALGDFFQWIGILRRLQQHIDQANLKFRAAEVFTLCLLIAGSTYLVQTLFVSMIFLRLLVALALGSIPVLYINHVRSKRLRKFEEQLPDAIDLFNRSMKAGHNIHAGLETIAAETFDPVRMEFKKVIE